MTARHTLQTKTIGIQNQVILIQAQDSVASVADVRARQHQTTGRRQEQSANILERSAMQDILDAEVLHSDFLHTMQSGRIAALVDEPLDVPSDPLFITLQLDSPCPDTLGRTSAVERPKRAQPEPLLGRPCGPLVQRITGHHRAVVPERFICSEAAPQRLPSLPRTQCQAEVERRSNLEDVPTKPLSSHVDELTCQGAHLHKAQFKERPQRFHVRPGVSQPSGSPAEVLQVLLPPHTRRPSNFPPSHADARHGSNNHIPSHKVEHSWQHFQPLSRPSDIGWRQKSSHGGNQSWVAQQELRN
mmetsp:Transcript_91971/g.297535  ORF Transcript_91971/g.297535 Transcript_91971/m.297535 type:complete len:301 (-) Transcript_91971:17-919(-)